MTKGLTNKRRYTMFDEINGWTNVWLFCILIALSNIMVASIKIHHSIAKIVEKEIIVNVPLSKCKNVLTKDDIPKLILNKENLMTLEEIRGIL